MVNQKRIVTQRPRSSAHQVWLRHNMSGRRVLRGMCIAAITVITVSLCAAPTAVADASESLRSAVAAVRGMACGPLRSNPTVDQAAEAVNATTDRWINNTARATPETDALPLLKDLGYGGKVAKILSGAAKTDANAIKGVLIQGYAEIPNCGYTDFGVSALYNAKKDMTLTTIVLAG